MKTPATIKIIGLIEVLIGLSALLTILSSLALQTNEKSANVLIFVVIAGCISCLLGVGLLLNKRLAYQLLLYFSTVIILSKILIFMGIIHLNGELEMGIPGPVKNLISMFYHAFVVAILIKDNADEHIQL